MQPSESSDQGRSRPLAPDFLPPADIAEIVHLEMQARWQALERAHQETAKSTLRFPQKVPVTWLTIMKNGRMLFSNPVITTQEGNFGHA